MIFISYLIVVMADKMMSESACTRRGDYTLTLADMQTTNFLSTVPIDMMQSHKRNFFTKIFTLKYLHWQNSASNSCKTKYIVTSDDATDPVIL